MIFILLIHITVINERRRSVPGTRKILCTLTRRRSINSDSGTRYVYLDSVLPKYPWLAVLFNIDRRRVVMTTKSLMGLSREMTRMWKAAGFARDSKS